MSTRILVLKDGVITPAKTSTDTTNIINSLGVVDLVNNQTIGGIKTFSGGFALPTTLGTSIGAIWRNIDTLEYKDSANVTKILLNSAGNLSNLSNKQLSLNNLVGTQIANRLLRSDGTSVILSQVGLTTDVIGVLPIANGGTNSSTQTWIDLTTAQTIAGNKTFTDIPQIQGLYPGFWLDEVDDFTKGAFLVLDGGNLQVQRRATNFGAFEATIMSVSLINGVVKLNMGVPSTSTTTGVLQIAGGGGVGITGNIYAGGSVINFAALPTSATGLAVGSLWRNGTVVNIV